MIKFVVVIFLLKAEMIERDFEGKKQMPQVATTLTKDVLLSVVGKHTIIIRNEQLIDRKQYELIN